MFQTAENFIVGDNAQIDFPHFFKIGLKPGNNGFHILHEIGENIRINQGGFQNTLPGLESCWNDDGISRQEIPLIRHRSYRSNIPQTA